MKQDLLNKISILGKELPLNTLDELIDKFGGPDKVSEVQGLENWIFNNEIVQMGFTSSSLVTA